MLRLQEIEFNKVHTTIVVSAEQQPLCDLSFRDLFTSDIHESPRGIAYFCFDVLFDGPSCVVHHEIGQNYFSLIFH